MTTTTAADLLSDRRMRQLQFIPQPKREHGGAHSVGKRRSRRPLSTQEPLHVTLRSELAKAQRSLHKNRGLIEHILSRSAKRFSIRIYRQAVCGNHLHVLVKGRHREDIQNFFRVFAGHTAQALLRKHPLTRAEEPKSAGCKKNHRKFWQLLIYSRVLTWGREFKTVAQYINQNVLETLNVMAYVRRKKAPS